MSFFPNTIDPEVVAVLEMVESMNFSSNYSQHINKLFLKNNFHFYGEVFANMTSIKTKEFFEDIFNTFKIVNITKSKTNLYGSNVQEILLILQNKQENSQVIFKLECSINKNEESFDSFSFKEEIKGFIVAGKNAENISQIKDVAEKYKFRKKVKKQSGKVYMFGLRDKELVLIESPHKLNFKINEKNYIKQELQKHNYVVENIGKKECKNEKIAIYQGPPGTGKTFAIRHLISKMSKCFTVLVSPQMMKHLAQPDFISLLSDMNTAERPVILIIEDADEILTKRTKENIESLSNLLNFGDGIMGSILDVRIVATTNATIKEFDPAITRPGRLLKLINFDKLSVEEARNCIKDIYPEIEDYDLDKIRDKMSLAECYEFAKNKKELIDGYTRN